LRKRERENMKRTSPIRKIARKESQTTSIPTPRKRISLEKVRRHALATEAVVEIEGGALKAKAGVSRAGVERLTGPPDEKRGCDEFRIRAVDTILSERLGSP